MKLIQYGFNTINHNHTVSVMDPFLDPNEQIKKFRQWIIQSKYIIVLILVNFITNYLFIFQYKFYSDDWSVVVNPDFTRFSYFHYILNTERPIYDVIYKFQRELLGDYTLVYHILGLISTTILLILIYKIAKKIFADFNYTADIYPFLGALIFCVLFNKDEIYPFALLAFNFPFIIYMVSFYAYINKERDHYLVYSLIAYTLGLFTYESGIALPAIFLSYDILLKKDYKKSFLFAIPLIFNLLVRKTIWFGYGNFTSGQGFGQWGVQSILQNTFDFMSVSIFMVFRQILYALHGLQELNVLIIGIIIVNFAILYVLYKLIDFNKIPRSGNIYLGLLLVIITAVFAFPFILRGGLLSGSLPTRSFEFIDIGIAFLLVFIVAYLSKPQILKILLLIFIGTCIFLCQGLCMNWVISGNIQDDVYQYIGEHSDEIQTYDYVYFNTSSYIINQPNAIDESVFYPIAKIYYQYIRHDPQALEQRIKAQQQKSSGLTVNNEYDRYFNAKGLDNYALASMLSVKTEKFDDKNYTNYLIYGKTTNVPLEVTNNYIVFQQPFPGGQNITVEKSRVYEINYDKVYPLLTPQ
jgi:hypothetical protein